MAKIHRLTADRRKFFIKYYVAASLRRTTNDWCQSYVERGSNAHRGGNGRPPINITKQNLIKEMFELDIRRSL